MCGILVSISSGPMSKASFQTLLDKLSHRGPDAGEIMSREEGRVCLGHRRLKILDLSNQANQPMTSACGNFTIVFNGEIYNFRELRSRFLANHTLRTSGDTEVLLELFAGQGAACLDHLNGMFAFAVYDHSRRNLFVARDRFGIKPLYYIQSQGLFALASEPQVLLPLLRERKANPRVLNHYLRTAEYDYGPETFFDGILRLDSGHLLQIALDDLTPSINRWYDIERNVGQVPTGTSTAELEEQAGAILRASVDRHLVADVPVGLNLSGGVDSSLLGSLAVEGGQSLKAFSQDWPGYSERPWVEELSRHCGIPCYFSTYTPEDVLELLPAIVRSQAEPFGGLGVIGYDALYRDAVSQDVTVLLDGNGMDEVALGYRKYHLDWISIASDDHIWEKRLQEFCAFWQESPDAVAGQIKNVLGKGRSIDGSIGVMPSCIGSALQDLKEPGCSYVPVTEQYGPVRNAAWKDLLMTKVPRGLRFNDRASMRHSRELRVPFLDHEWVEFCLCLSPDLLLNMGGTKAMVRQILHKRSGGKLALAPKRSIQTPQREWLAGPLAPLVRDILHSESFRNRNWIDIPLAQKEFELFVKEGRPNSFYIWQWLNLELWARELLD